MLNFMKNVLSPKPKGPKGLHLAATRTSVVMHNDGQLISITPDLADKLAKELPAMAMLSRKIANQEIGHANPDL